MRRYIQRSIKYFISRCTLFLVLLYALSYTTIVVFSPEKTFHVLTGTMRGHVLILAILIFSITYPLYGFVTRYVHGNVKSRRDEIVALFEKYGMVLHHQTEGRLTFIERSQLKRFCSLYEDHVKVIDYPEGAKESGRGGIMVVGARKRTSRMAYILEVKLTELERNV